MVVVLVAFVIPVTKVGWVLGLLVGRLFGWFVGWKAVWSVVWRVSWVVVGLVWSASRPVSMVMVGGRG